MPEEMTPKPDETDLPIDDIWAQNETLIQAKLENILQHTRGYRSMDNDKKQKALEGLMRRERAFFSHLMTTVKRALKDIRHTTRLVLLDIDDTIAKTILSNDRSSTTIVRPAIGVALSTLVPFIKAGKVEIGLLSSRDQEKLIDQLADPMSLHSLEPYINKQRVYSVKGYNKSPEYESLLTNSVVNVDEITKGTMRYDIGYDDYAKLAKLDEIWSQLPDRTIAVIDDIGYPNLLHEDAGFYGCKLPDEEKFNL